MKLHIIFEKLTHRNLKYTFFASLILLVIIYPIMGYYFLLSNYPVGFMESQLSFSGEIIKSHLLAIDIESYRIGQILDYGFMISYGLIGFSLALLIGRKYSDDSIWAKISPFIALFMIVAAICDGIENAFILLMLMNPLNFPNSLAIIHSYFALVKYVLMLTSIGWFIIATINLIIKKIQKN